MQNQQNKEVCIYLLDIMMDLKFLNQKFVENNYEQIEKSIQKQTEKLVIFKHDKQQLAAVMGNLETICCAIQNYNIKYTQYKNRKDIEPLSDRILSCYLGIVTQNKRREEAGHVVDQMAFIENIVKEAKFSLTEQ